MAQLNRPTADGHTGLGYARRMNPAPPQVPEAARRLLEAQYRESLAPVTDRMFASAGLVAGQRVLDVGTGSGDTALIAAQRVGPTGQVLATDASQEALHGLAACLRALESPPPITLEAVAAEALALEPASFDIALARNSVMYFTDAPRAFRNIRAALRAGGRLIVTLYGPLEREPFHAVPVGAVRRRCTIREPYPDYVQAFRVGADDVEPALLDAGFAQVERHVVTTRRTFPSLAEAIGALQHSRSLAQLMSLLPSNRREDAWWEIEAGWRRYQGSSGLRIPGEQVVLVAAAAPGA